MRHIDAFCHFFPQSLFEKMSQTSGGTKDIGKRMQGVRTIWDLDARLQDDGRVRRLLARFSRSGCRRSRRWRARTQAPEFARVANDGLAELCAKYPDRFAG